MPVVPRAFVASGQLVSVPVPEPLLPAQRGKSPASKTVTYSRGSRTLPLSSDDYSSVKGGNSATTAVRTVEPTPPLPADQDRLDGSSSLLTIV